MCKRVCLFSGVSVSAPFRGSGQEKILRFPLTSRKSHVGRDERCVLWVGVCEHSVLCPRVDDFIHVHGKSREASLGNIR